LDIYLISTNTVQTIKTTVCRFVDFSWFFEILKTVSRNPYAGLMVLESLLARIDRFSGIRKMD
jgi:hypothetical protein